MNRSGPGELTLAAVALVGIGVYAALAGPENSQLALAAVGLFAMVLFVAGVVWPWVSLSRVQVDATAPADATVGDVVALHVSVFGRVSRLELRVLDPAGEWRRCRAPGEGDLFHSAARRGMFHFVHIEVRTAAPLGVFQRRRVLIAPLARPIAVGPMPTREYPAMGPIGGGDIPTPLPVASPTTGDVVRAVRPYVPGDAARLVHWPTSARRGELVVREHEPAVVSGIAIVVDLRGTEDEAEAAASRAGLANATLGAGGRVVLVTVEADGPVVAPVQHRRAVGRRLAACVSMPYSPAPPPPPDGWPVLEVRAR